VPRWERKLPAPALAVSVEPLGGAVAVSDRRGGLSVLDADGSVRWQTATPRPLHALAFVPEEPLLAGCADFGLVMIHDDSGQCVWRDAVVAHLGSLAVSGDGLHVALACFSEGVAWYTLDHSRPREPRLVGQRRLTQSAPCRLAALSYPGDVLLTAGLENDLAVRDRDGNVRGEYSAEGSPVALAVDALGRSGVVALLDGSVVCLSTQRD
jgi:hypothetical protein